MIIENFTYDGKHYFVDIVNNSIAFFIRNYDFVYDDEDSSLLTNNTKDPVKLLRRIEKIVRNHIYRRKLNYFTFYADSPKRIKLYQRFADSLVGYNYYRYEGSFYFNKV